MPTIRARYRDASELGRVPDGGVLTFGKADANDLVLAARGIDRRWYPGRHVRILTLGIIAIAGLTAAAQPVSVRISAQPLHDGRINPMLFGNFIELLDDLVPGMWAEMLNDRGFDGVTKPANWVYCDGEPNVCDRQWDKSDSWTYDTSGAFNGSRSAKLTPIGTAPAILTQSGLATVKGATCQFSGYLRCDVADAEVTMAIKAELPDGTWMTLGAVSPARPSSQWEKRTASIVPTGTTDRAVFEIKVTGPGSLWVDKLSLMPADAIHGWRKDVVQAIKAVKPAVIRWGGSVCDPGGYLWKDGIGDRDRRIPFPNKVWGRIDSNDVGIDEFLQFCELVEAQPLVCISFADGPQSAAELVHYCNDKPDTDWGRKRAAHGHPKPYGVRYWQLGNELGDAKYAETCPAFCKAMRAADPDVLLLASFPSQALLDKAGALIHYIGPHHYTPDLAGCEKDFVNLSHMIRNTPGCGHIRIAVTEWNVSAGNWGLMRGKFLTLETAVLNARYLNLLSRYSNIVDMACRSNMTNSLGSGIIATSPTGLLRRPSYYVMKLYADHFKPIPVGVNGVPEGVDIAACASEDRKALCVFAVNTKPEPVELQLDLHDYGSGFQPVGAEVVCDTQDARQPDVMNHWSAPDRVRTVDLPVSHVATTLPALCVAAIECKPQISP